MDVGTLPNQSGRVFDRDDELANAHHEQVVFCRDESTGLRAIISIHDTTLGPALGGTRFYDYPSEDAALRDGLRLAQGMTFKAAAAGLPLGGGKAVIMGDPRTRKTPELLRAYGRFVDSLGGRYVTAADVGTTSEDLDIIGETTRQVTGRTRAAGGSGDSGLATAQGVFFALRAAASHRWGKDALRGRHVGVEGVGKVGLHVSTLLVDAGARVTVADPDRRALERAVAAVPALAVAESVISLPVDVYAPCALGGTLSRRSLDTLGAEIVCGAANNQLETREVDALLRERGVLWVPDYVANAGGVVQVGSEYLGWGQAGVSAAVERIGDTVRDVIALADDLSTSTGDAAAEIVRSRMDAGRTARANRVLVGSDDAHR